jgi:hypothetical protein
MNCERKDDVENEWNVEVCQEEKLNSVLEFDRVIEWLKMVEVN